jgi:predicted outer membrane protein
VAKRDVHAVMQPSKGGEIRTIDTSVEIEASRLATSRHSSPQQRWAFANTVVSSAQATARKVIAEIAGPKEPGHDLKREQP